MTDTVAAVPRAARTRPRPAPAADTWRAPITGFRGIAAILVVAGHTFMATRTYPFTSVIHVIGLIVPTFFVISAYALYRPFLLADVEGAPVPSARSFWWKRFLRIYPLYATALTLYLVALPGVRPPGGRIADYAKLYGFLQVYDPDLSTFSGIPAAWFLCDEVAFYLFLPLIALAARSVARRGGRPANARRRLRSHVVVAVGMVVVGTVARTYLVLSDVPSATSLPISNLDYYGFGILLAAASIGEARGQRLPAAAEWLRRRPGFAVGMLVAGIAAMNLVARNPGQSFSPEEDIGRYTLYTLMVVPLMTVMVLGAQRQGFNRGLGSKRWAWLAVLSLHAYLWHQLLLGVFDRYVTEIAEVELGPRVVTGAILTVGAVAATVVWSLLWRPLLDLPYARWGRSLPRPAGAPPLPTWVRPVAVGVAVVLVAGATVAALRYGGSPLDARGGVGLLSATGAEPGDEVLAARGDDVVERGTADAQGAVVLRDLRPGRYRVAQRRDGREVVSRHVTVLAPDDVPDRSLYEGQELQPGLNEITTRDGTRLSAFVDLPGPVEDGPYPTVVEYSAYRIGDPEITQPASAAARAMGYATVGVNVRGTGCSGGAFDLFGPAQAADGYDVVEAVAAQDWVTDHRVGMAGFSYGGLAALQVASTAPPSLRSVAALSVYGEAWQAFHPGGLDNAGFPVGWLRDLQADAEPSGAGWVRARIAEGDDACAANQELHAQQADLPGTYLGRVPDDGRFADRSPATWAPTIEVPLLLSSQFQDSTLGSELAEHLDDFSASPTVKLVLGNGTHGDGVAPQVLARMSDFLGLYVGDEVAGPLDVAALLEEIRPGTDPDLLPGGPLAPVLLPKGEELAEARADYEAGPPIEVLWESGGGDVPGAATARWSSTAAAWPPPGVEPQAWHLAPGGVLAPVAGSAATAARFTTDPDVAAVPYSTEGSDLVSNDFVGWDAPDPSANVAWESAPLAEDLVLAGTASVDLWVRADATDVDLQAVLLEVSPDDDETLVQTGWLRASAHTTTDDSTELRPDVDFAPEARQDLVPGTWTKVRLRLGSFAHALRAGSRVRLLVGTPGGSQVQWSFGPPPAGAAQVDVGQGGDLDSQLVLPVSAEEAPAGTPACGSLRGQPCRPRTPLTNLEVASS